MSIEHAIMAREVKRVLAENPTVTHTADDLFDKVKLPGGKDRSVFAVVLNDLCQGGIICDIRRNGVREYGAARVGADREPAPVIKAEKVHEPLDLPPVPKTGSDKANELDTAILWFLQKNPATAYRLGIIKDAVCDRTKYPYATDISLRLKSLVDAGKIYKWGERNTTIYKATPFKDEYLPPVVRELSPASEADGGPDYRVVLKDLYKRRQALNQAIGSLEVLMNTGVLK